MHKKYFFIIMAMIAAISGVLFGYDTGVVSGAILFINDEYQLTAQTNGIVVSAVLFGALLGAIASGRLADALGRKRLLLLDAVTFIIGTLGTAMGSSIDTIIIARMVVGLAIGVASYVTPLYISEISPTQYRGALVSLNQLAITIGILLSYIVDYYFSQFSEWREMFAVGVIPATLFFIGLLFLPDSPRWIAAQGKTSLALAILNRIHQNPTLAQRELQSIESSLHQQPGTWRMLFSPTIRSTLTIGVGLAVIQQVTGINTIVYYAPTLFKMVGFQSATTAILATMGLGVVFVIFTLIALPLIDTLGRRPLLLSGLTGMGLSLLCMSYAFAQSADSVLLKWLALASMLLYVACFAFSLGPIMWLMIAEIYPLKVRGLGSSIATAANWGSNMLVALTFLTMIKWLGTSGTFLTYSIISVGGLIFIYYLVPETKHVSLEQIEANLHAGHSFRKLGQVKIFAQAQEG